MALSANFQSGGSLSHTQFNELVALVLSHTNALSNKADLASGVIPEAQIPAGIARDTEVQAAVAALIGSAPTTLDTIAELASALQADEAAASSLTTLIGTKAKKAVPTAVKTSAYTAAAGDVVLMNAGTAALTVTLPTGATAGDTISVKKVDSSANLVTVAAGAGGSISTGPTATSASFDLTAQGVSRTLVSQGNDKWTVVAGYLPLDVLDARYMPAGGGTGAGGTIILAAANKTPSEAPAPASKSPVVGTVNVAARSDHQHPSQGLFTQYGIGLVDVDLNGVDAAAYTNGPAQSIYQDPTTKVYFLTEPSAIRNLTVRAGAVLNTNGFILRVSETLNNLGTIRGPVATPTADGTAAVASPGYASFFAELNTPVGAPPAGTIGASTSSGADIYMTLVFSTDNTVSLAGKGGDGASGTGGQGDRANSHSTWAPKCANSPMTAFTSHMMGGYAIFRGTQNNAGALIPAPGGTPGWSGVGDGTNKGGAGGDGGYAVLVSARRLLGSGVITSPGSAGGAGVAGNTGGGAGGSGGWVIVNTTDASGWTGTITAPGGAGGAGKGTGTAGAKGADSGATYLNVWG